MDIVCDVVKKTLGPAGRNVIIERKGKTPMITNDGVAVAREIILKDEIEDLGAQAVINVATKTNEEVGDGTTTSMVLAQAIVDKVFKKMAEDKLAITGGDNVMDISRQIDIEREDIVKKLEKLAKPIKDKKDVQDVAVIALENEEVGMAVGEMVHKVGKDGFISVEDGYGTKTKSEVVPGMKVVGTYISEALATNHRKEAVIDNPMILITNKTIDTQIELKTIADGLLKQGKTSLVVIAAGYGPEILPFAVVNKIKKSFFLLAIKAPALTSNEMEDVACYTGSRFFDKSKDLDIKDSTMTTDDFGRAKKIMVDRNHVFIMDGKGDKNEIEERIQALKVERDDVEKADPMKKRIDRRIASLSGGVGMIEVACKTDIEREYLRMKVEDAVCACKAAMEEGVVKGGGLALKEIAEKMPKGSIIKEPIEEPFNQIRANAGKDVEIPDTVIDPMKVVKSCLENACSFAKTFILTSSAIAWKREDLKGELKRAMRPEI